MTHTPSCQSIDICHVKVFSPGLQNQMRKASLTKNGVVMVVITRKKNILSFQAKINKGIGLAAVIRQLSAFFCWQKNKWKAAAAHLVL